LFQFQIFLAGDDNRACARAAADDRADRRTFSAAGDRTDKRAYARADSAAFGGFLGLAVAFRFAFRADFYGFSGRVGNALQKS